MTKLSIDTDRCEGHGRCYDIAPEIFASDDFGHGQVIVDISAGPVDNDAVWQAVQACPEQAITFEP